MARIEITKITGGEHNNHIEGVLKEVSFGENHEYDAVVGGKIRGIVMRPEHLQIIEESLENGEEISGWGMIIQNPNDEHDLFSYIKVLHER